MPITPVCQVKLTSSPRLLNNLPEDLRQLWSCVIEGLHWSQWERLCHNQQTSKIPLDESRHLAQPYPPMEAPSSASSWGDTTRAHDLVTRPCHSESKCMGKFVGSFFSGG
mmetsp:Transcript_13604/g.37598  ORF Transcript_13604/g.37598 Transcript_13604/m.37598 type:complete len:110 (+) Transcript_13604:1046-1375(+)